MNEEQPFQLFRTRNSIALAVPLTAYMGLRFDRPVLVALGAMAIAMMLVMFALGAYQASCVRVSRKVTAGAFEGDAVDVELTLTNHGWLPIGLLIVADRFPPAEYSLTRIVVGDGLPARSRSRITYLGRCKSRRGRYDVGPIRVRVLDPLGLFEHDRILRVHDEFLVYPKPQPLDQLLLDGTSTRHAARVVSQRHTGASPSFHGTREYRTGDEPRTIHWPTSARRGKLVVAEFDREVARRLTVFLDLDARTRGGLGQRSVLEYAVKIAASLANHGIEQRSLVELVIHARRERVVRAGAGRPQLLRVLGALVDVKQDAPAPLLRCLERHLPRLPPDAAVAIVTSSAALADDDAAADLAARCRAARRHRLRRPVIVLLDSASFMQLAAGEYRDREEARRRAIALSDAGAIVYLVGADRPLAPQLAAPWHDEPEPAEEEAA